MKPSSLLQIAHYMQIACKNLPCTISGVSVDSRLSTNGDLFFALPGAMVDGHSFLADVATKGAVAAVVKCDYAGPNYGMELLHSEDVLASLQLLAHNFVKQSRAITVAVTGSVGKTTTKDFITTLLKSKYKVSSSPGNSNSQVGLPLAILNHSTLEEDFLVLEMGMTHPGQIAKLVQIAPPSLAVITSIALVHAGNFDSIEEIARAKAELFSHPDTKLGIYPKEYNFGEVLSKTGSSRKLAFSTKLSTADYFLDTLKDNLTLFTHGESLSQFPLSNLPGEHNHHNFLAAAVAARNLGMSWEEIRLAQM
nr:UDP-N-acetylmuramoyl-tripeptide--D-alanyl-D-alanine ligase [Parachlamydiaceae bacterium]